MDGNEAFGRLLRIAGLGPRDDAEAALDEYPYVCRGCGTAYDVEYHVCPDCGGFSVEYRPRRDADVPTE
jgi:hypothetical protein